MGWPNKTLCFFFILLATVVAAQVATSSSASLLEDAGHAMAAGNLHRADADLQSVLRQTPQDYRAIDLLGVVRVLQHRNTDAESLFRKALLKKPDFAPAQAHLGLLYVQTGRASEAEPHLREALRLDSSRRDAADALVALLRDEARAAVDDKDLKKAFATLTDAAKYAPDNAGLQVEIGTVELQLSLWNDAVLSLQRALAIDNNQPLALYDLGRAYLGERKFEEARQQFAKYVALRPNDAAGHCSLGMTLAALEHLPEARSQFEQSIALDPKQTESYLRLALIEPNEEDLDAAAKNLTAVLTLDPQHAAALSAMGRVYFEQKHYPEAIEVLQRAIASDGSMREPHYYLGLVFARVGRKEESAEQLQIATRLEHDEAERRRTSLRLSDQGDNPHPQPPN